MTDHEYWDELAAGYALHGLAPDEEILFIAHLETCEQCAQSVSDHEMVAAQLGSIAHYRETEDDAPSWESMRNSIVGAREPASPLASVSDLADGSEEYDPGFSLDLDELGARRRRYNSSRRVLAAAAAVVVVAGGGITVWQVESGSSSCSASAGCHTVSLDAKGGHEAASIVVRDASVTVTPTNMATAAAGKVYVLWQMPRDGQATPIDTFNVANGKSTAVGTLTSSYSDISEFAISVENAKGAPPPSPSNTLASGVAT